MNQVGWPLRVPKGHDDVTCHSTPRPIELRETEVTELIQRKLLEAGARHDANAVRKALYRHLDDSTTRRKLSKLLRRANLCEKYREEIINYCLSY